MRLTKKTKDSTVKACSEVSIDLNESEDSTPKFDAYHHIMEAIDALKECDESDPAVVEAVANLSVVAFSLK